MSENGFLKRWSERKREHGQQGAEAAEPPEPEPEKAAFDNLSEEELAQLTPLDAMTAETGLGQYLRHGVPAALRREALRKMWLLNPKIRDYLDDARDYAWDWNAPGKLPAATLTAERAVEMAARVLRGSPPTLSAQAPEAEALALSEPAPETASFAVPAPVPAPAPKPQLQRRRHGGATPSASEPGR